MFANNRTSICTQVGYKSILHIHASMEECEITKMVAEVDMKTKEHKKARFVKQGGMCICRISVDKPICLETFQVRRVCTLVCMLSHVYYRQARVNENTHKDVQ